MKFLRWHILPVLIAATLCTPNAIAAVGKVIIAKGDTYAVDSASNSRPLKRRSEIMEGDTLITGEDSEIHIRFQDNAVLALRADSSLKISEYHAASDSGEEKVLMELLSGGFRTITGSFGKADKEAYQIRTPNASIGIRGTNYEALLNNNDLLVGVYQGGVSLQNSAGIINLGADSAFNFARVPSMNQRIEGLIEAPSELKEPLATSFRAQPVPNEEQEQEQSANIQEEDEGLLVEKLFAGEEESLQPTQQPEARPIRNALASIAPPDATKEDLKAIAQEYDLLEYYDVRLTQEQIRQLKEGAPTGFVVVNENPEGYRVPVYTMPFTYGGTTFTPTGALTFDVTLKSGDQTFTYTVDLQGTSGSVFTEISAQLDSSLGGDVNGAQVPARVVLAYDATNNKLVFTGLTDESGAEIVLDNFQGTDAVALALEMGLCSSAPECTGSYNLGAPSTGNYDHATHFGYMVSGESGPVFVNFNNESIYALKDGYKAPDHVFRGNKDAPRVQFDDVDTTGSSNLVRWGYWNTSATNPAVLLKDRENLSNAELVEAPFFYVTAPPTAQADLVGTKTLSTVVAWRATSTTSSGMMDGSGLATLDATLNVDFGTAEAFGNVHLHNSSELWDWNVEYFGEVRGAQFFSDWGFGSLTLNGNATDAVGHIDGLFTDADTGQGFVGGFGLQTTNDQHQAQGIFIIKE